MDGRTDERTDDGRTDGWPLWQGQFTPFGAELADGSTSMHYKFTGKERDAESGLDYFGARFYGSAMGRWMSPDWALKPEAVPYSKLDDPQTLNLYAYVGNNPLSRADVDGHCSDWTCNAAEEYSGKGGNSGEVTTAKEDLEAEEQRASNDDNNKPAQQQSGAGTVPVVVGQRPIQNKWAQFFSELFTFHKAYHSYYRLTGNDGTTHQFEVLGDPGSSHNQQVRDTYGTSRASAGTEHTVYATDAQASALINRSEYFESHPCPVCTGGQEGYNLVFHNSNSFVYNMLGGAPVGGIPVPAAPVITPGYAKRPDDWY